MDMTTYLKNKLYDHVLRNTSYTSPTTVYVGLYNGDPTDAGTGGTEVTTDVRAAGRVALTVGAPTDGAGSNPSEVTFGESDGAATVTHITIHDAASSGNILMYDTPTGGTQTVSAGNTVKFNATKLAFTFA